jgi:integrase
MSYLRKISGRYYAYFSDPLRKRKVKSYPLGTTQKRVAETLYQRLSVKLAEGTFDPWSPSASPPKPQTLEELVESFLKAQNRREKTVKGYRSESRGLLRSMGRDVSVDKITLADIRTYVEDPQVSLSTRRTRGTHLKALFKWATREGYIPDNPMQDYKLPKAVKTEPAYLSPAQVQMIIDHIRSKGDSLEWLARSVLILANTGLRRGELARLQWRDINFETRLLTVRSRIDGATKSGHERTIPISDNLLLDLEAAFKRTQPAEDSPVVVLGSGQPPAPDYIYKTFKRQVLDCPQVSRTTLHGLRHAYASWLVSSGTPLPVVQELLGHAEITTTMKYAHLAPDAKVKAMQLLPSLA